MLWRAVLLLRCAMLCCAALCCAVLRYAVLLVPSHGLLYGHGVPCSQVCRGSGS